MKYLVVKLVALFLFCNTSVFGQELPLDRMYDWGKAGTNTFIDRSNARIVSVTDFGAIPNDELDDSNAFQDAINDAKGRFTIIRIPIGTFKLSKGLSLKDSIIFKGVSAEESVIECEFKGSASTVFSISGNAPTSFISILNQPVKFTSVIVGTFSKIPSVGDWAEIRMENGTWDVAPASWAVNSVGHISSIKAIQNTEVVLESPLRFTVESTLSPEIGVFTPISTVGFECFSVVRKDSAVNGAGNNFAFTYAINSWVRGVKSIKSVGAHIFISKSSNISITSNYISDAFEFTGSGTRGYGVCLAEHPNLCLIENNIFKTLRHSMMVKQGANGNVFAYNYSIEPKRSEPIADFSGDISSHGHYPFANLFEGNIVQNIIIDHFWGPSGADNLYFRNKAELYGFIITTADSLSNKQNIIANDITNTGFLNGQFLLNGSNHFLWGNRVKGTLNPSNPQGVQPQSFHYDKKPWFWKSNISDWQTIGHPYPIASSTSPANDRYKTIDKCPCDSFHTVVTTVKKDEKNYIYTFNSLKMYFGDMEEIKVYTLTGTSTVTVPTIHFLDPKALPNGIYILKSITKNAFFYNF